MYTIFEQILQEKGLTSSQVAKDLGIARSVLSDWKNGISVPKTERMVKIAKYFGVSVEYLMTGEQPEQHHISDAELKLALFGGDTTVTDEMWQEAKDYAKFILEREKRKGNNDNKQ